MFQGTGDIEESVEEGMARFYLPLQPHEAGAHDKQSVIAWLKTDSRSVFTDLKMAYLYLHESLPPLSERTTETNYAVVTLWQVLKPKKVRKENTDGRVLFLTQDKYLSMRLAEEDEEIIAAVLQIRAIKPCTASFIEKQSPLSSYPPREKGEENKDEKNSHTTVPLTEGKRLDTFESFVPPSNDSNLSNDKTIGQTLGNGEKSKKKGNASSLNAARKGKKPKKEKKKEEQEQLLLSVNTYGSDQGGGGVPDEENGEGLTPINVFGPSLVNVPLIRWARSNQLSDKLLSTYGFLEPFPGGVIDSFRHRLHYCLRAGAVPVNNTASLRVWMSFLQGFYWISDKVWPAGFTALLVHDFVLYFRDQLETTPWYEIVGGYADSPSLWSTRFSDLTPYDPRYWIGPVGFIALPFLVGFMNTVIRSLGDSCVTPESTRNTLENRSILRDWVTALIPSVLFGTYQRALSRTRFAILYDRNLDGLVSRNDKEEDENIGERETYFDVVNGLANEHAGFARWQAMGTLAAIADSFTSANLDDANIAPTDQALFRRLKQSAQDTLTDLANLPLFNAPITRPYSRYLLASIGKMYPKDKFLAGVVAVGAVLTWLGILLAKLRGVQMVYNATRYGIEFYTAPASLPLCEDSRPKRAYLSTFGEDACTVCGHWPQMFAGNVFDAQSCANGLFQISRSPQELIDSLHYLSHFPNVTVADVSRQDWPGWTDEEFDTFLNTLAEFPQLTTLNLARGVSEGQGVSLAKAASLSRFIQRMNLTHVSLASQSLGLVEVQTLVRGFSNSTVVDLNLSHCVAEGSMLLPLIDALPSMHHCQSVDLSGNHFGNTEVERICIVGPHTSIRVLDLQDSPDIGQTGFDTLGQTLPHWRLTQLRISNTDLTYVELEPFWQGVGNSSLVEIGITHSRLPDEQLLVGVPYVVGSNLMTLNVSDNPSITDTGFVGALYGLRESKLATYDFSNTAITNQGLRSVSTFWSEMKAVESINISNCRFDNSGFSIFLRAKQPSHWCTLIATDNNLTDDIAPALNDLIGRGNSTLRVLDLSRNVLSDTLGVLLGHSLLISPLEKLILVGNRFTGQTATVIGGALSQHRLIYIDLSDNPISGNPITNITSFALALSNSTLKTLILRNALSGEDLRILFSHLITPMPALPADENAKPSRSTRQAFAKANATTPIQHLDVGDPITTQQATEGCLVRYPSRIADFQMQPVNGSVDVVTCAFPSSASRSQGVGLEIYRFLQESVVRVCTWFSPTSDTIDELPEHFYLDSDERASSENMSVVDASADAAEMERLLHSLASRTKRWAEPGRNTPPTQFFLSEQTPIHDPMSQNLLALPNTETRVTTSPTLGSTMMLGLVSGGTVLVVLGGFLLLALLIQWIQKLMVTDTHINEVRAPSQPEVSPRHSRYSFVGNTTHATTPAFRIETGLTALPPDDQRQLKYKQS
jgi:hypothetical protein